MDGCFENSCFLAGRATPFRSANYLVDTTLYERVKRALTCGDTPAYP